MGVLRLQQFEETPLKTRLPSERKGNWQGGNLVHKYLLSTYYNQNKILDMRWGYKSMLKHTQNFTNV